MTIPRRGPTGANAIIRNWTSYTSIAAIRDGTSNTLLLGEKHVRPTQLGRGDGDQNSFYSGENYRSAQRSAGAGFLLIRDPLRNASATRFGSPHNGFVQFVMCDGSIRQLRTTIDGTNLGRFANRHDGLRITYQD